MKNKDGFTKIPIGEIPEYFKEEVNKQIRLYSVCLVISTAEDTESIPCAGTLCQIDKYYGIVTAGHVWKETEKRGRKVIIVIGKNQVPVRKDYLRAYDLYDATDRGIKLPDIAFICLPRNTISTIKALNKVFYSIDKRLADPTYELNRLTGYLVSFGSPYSLLEIDKEREKGTVSSLCYSTMLKRKYEEDDWDYLELDVDFEAEPRMPKSLKGMSGGGIWNVRFFIDPGTKEIWLENCQRDILFYGVNFYQRLENRHCTIISHGPKSIYYKLFEIIKKAPRTFGSWL